MQNYAQRENIDFYLLHNIFIISVIITGLTNILFFQEFESWNLGQEPSRHEPARQGSGNRNQKPETNRPAVLPQPDTFQMDEPFIDTSHYKTSRVVITPGTPTEPTYELEKKGHTSVIRVSYPGPESVQPPTPEPAQSFHRQRDSPSAQHRPSLPLRQDSAMGLESFHFVAVLGRGHFGKVSQTALKCV